MRLNLSNKLLQWKSLWSNNIKSLLLGKNKTLYSSETIKPERQSGSETLKNNKLIVIGGFSINYCKVGDGPITVFCYPGILGSMRAQVHNQIKLFDRTKFTFITWDQPGYGKSRPPERVVTDLSIVEDAELLKKFMDVLGYDKYSVMGWSGGGCSALFSAVMYPERIQYVVVWGAFSYVDEDDAKTYKWFGNTHNWGGRMKETLLEEYDEEFFHNHFSSWMDSFARIHTHHSSELLAKKLHKITCPTLIIHGTKDGLVNVKHGRFLAQKIKNSRYLEWKDGKHNIQLTHPEEFQRVVESFLLDQSASA